jgi:gamma-glutamyltranspeptidase/glutathione hydrolase
MVAAANPHASRAGLEVLRQGGSALDAAIAVQMVLNVVEPQSSGIGGGAFLLYYEAATRTVFAYDGRETAPAAASEDLFFGPDGEPMKFFDAVVGGRAVGVPGVLRMLDLAHSRHGKLPWAGLFGPAIAIAENGFEVSPRLNKLITGDRFLNTFATARDYFYRPDGTPRQVGDLLINRPLANTFKRIAEGGADAFYAGPIAADIANAVRGVTANPGLLTVGDLAGYEAKAREPVCLGYRDWRVCGMPPPTSGGVAVLQILGMLSSFDMGALEPNSAVAIHLIAEASRLAFADRGRFLADADFVDVPVRGLLDSGYLRDRARLIDRETTQGGRAAAGDPPFQKTQIEGAGASLEQPSTTHFSIVDAGGNAVSMTSSVESAFGSRMMVRGFLLNNQLTDFSFRPERDGVKVANRVQPGKRPRSSMSPTFVLADDGKLLMAIGSPGGSRIIGYVTQTIIAVLDWGLDIQAAINLPHAVNRNGATDIEEGAAPAGLKADLEARGHEVRERTMTSGLHGITVAPGGLTGGADPRREGLVVGD